MAAERLFTRNLARFFPRDRRRVPVGIGDDGAVVVAPRGRLVLTVDPVVVGVHCSEATRPSAIGRKAVNRNLSDLAAMGAIPDWLLVSVLLPDGFPVASRSQLFRGIRAAATRAKAQVIGGDVGLSPGPLTVTITAIGHVTGRAMTRDRARPGDRIHLTGPVGGSILGHHLTFQPRIPEGLKLARLAGIGAVMDVSDGLGLDLATMLANSSERTGKVLGAVLDEAAIPVAPAARRLAERTGRSALSHALSDGEDYELLFTVRERTRLPGDLPRQARLPIGEVVARPGLWIRRQDGSLERMQPGGYQHGL